MLDPDTAITDPAVDDDIDDELSGGCRELLFGFTALDCRRTPSPLAAYPESGHTPGRPEPFWAAPRSIIPS